MEAGRFAVLSEQAATDLLLTKDAANTKKANLRAYRTFRSYLNERNYDQTNFEEWETARLDEVLAKFYSEARTEKGELYKTTTLYSLRYSLNRYLTDYAIKEKKPVVDITNKESFPKSNEMFKACCKMLKKEGKGFIESAPPLEESDLLTLSTYFEENNNNSPDVLQQKVFFDMMVHLGRRGRENLRKLKQTDFAVTTDGDGELYVYSVNDEQTKNHQDDLHRREGRMYEVKGKFNFAFHLCKP